MRPRGRSRSRRRRASSSRRRSRRSKVVHTRPGGSSIGARLVFSVGKEINSTVAGELDERGDTRKVGCLGVLYGGTSQSLGGIGLHTVSSVSKKKAHLRTSTLIT